MMSSMVLERPTLVLNRNWQPVGVASVARSLVMVWNETARVVDPDVPNRPSRPHCIHRGISKLNQAGG